MTVAAIDRLKLARGLMEDFASRTGLLGKGGDIRRRYLWTDAFAAQTYLALAEREESKRYALFAKGLIDAVHETLGRHHPADVRKGWISGLPNEQALARPTVAGLRIGKKLPERGANERFDELLEWQRDGQYFHYLTRWQTALLQATEQSKDGRYADWAADLSRASVRFIDEGSGRMRWKMSVDLTRPLVESEGGHDPLEGLLCAAAARRNAPHADGLDEIVDRFAALCRGRRWITSDPLGIGGLLLAAARAHALRAAGVELPEEAATERLLGDAAEGVARYQERGGPEGPAHRRLAFRECGMTLGLRVVLGERDGQPMLPPSQVEQLREFASLADNLEGFWRDPLNQASPSWTEHLDINSVALAASLVASECPSVFA